MSDTPMSEEDVNWCELHADALQRRGIVTGEKILALLDDRRRLQALVDELGGKLLTIYKYTPMDQDTGDSIRNLLIRAGKLNEEDVR